MNQFNCSRCDICLINNHTPLLGDGNLDANILFIGRNPTAFEMKNNIPLISKDGMLFQRYLDLFNFNRDSIYVTNAVKCKTPNHRYPTDIEIMHCYDYLDLELNRIKPKIIVLMGDTAIRAYFKLAFSNLSIHTDHLNGQYMLHNGRIILFMIHPNHGLNSINARNSIFKTFCVLLHLYRCINPGHRTNINM